MYYIDTKTSLTGRYTPIKAGSRRQAKQIADSVNSATVYETRISDCQLKNRLFVWRIKNTGSGQTVTTIYNLCHRAHCQLDKPAIWPVLFWQNEIKKVQKKLDNALYMLHNVAVD